jgi:P27 family predicted phage terminase small subunit
MAQPKRRAAEAKAPIAPEAPKRARAKKAKKPVAEPVEITSAKPKKTAKPAKKKPPRQSKPQPQAPQLTRETIGGILEPDWSRLLPESAEQEAASEHWRRVAGEMHEQEILSLANGHSLQRLVLAYLVYDRCSKNVAADGLVTAPSADNPKSIARLSIHYKAMREAENTAERLEGQLGLTPGKRGRVGKVTKKRDRKAGADAFLDNPQA